MGGTVSKPNSNTATGKDGDANFEEQIQQLKHCCVKLIEKFFIQLKFVLLSEALGSYIFWLVKILEDCFQSVTLAMKNLFAWTTLTCIRNTDTDDYKMQFRQFQETFLAMCDTTMQISLKVNISVTWLKQLFKLDEDEVQVETLYRGFEVFSAFVVKLTGLIRDVAKEHAAFIQEGALPSNCNRNLEPRTVMKQIISMVGTFVKDTLGVEREYRDEMQLYAIFQWCYY